MVPQEIWLERSCFVKCAFVVSVSVPSLTFITLNNNHPLTLPQAKRKMIQLLQVHNSKEIYIKEIVQFMFETVSHFF